jgi:hypothetical protein
MIDEMSSRRDEIIKMARECGDWNGQTVEMNDVGLERFFHMAQAAEREAAEERVVDLFTDMETPYLPDIVAAIRRRSEIDSIVHFERSARGNR